MISMKFLNNPEIKRSVVLHIIVSIIVSLACLMINVECAVAVLLTGIIFTVMFIVITFSRYKNINKMSTEIDEILHNNEHISLSDFSEGELSILRDEIFKLTVALREKNSALQKEKIYLTDSIADISHQIRTPLTSLNLVVSMLSKSDLTEQRRYELIKQLENLLSHIDWLISSLLKISKLDANTANMTKVVVSVVELIRCATEPVEVPAELRGVTIKTSLSGNESFIGDLKWTVEAVENIIKNCMEHTAEGGVIEIKASENAIYTEIIVKDNGTGIDKEDIPHLFKRFYKGKNSSDQSVGIGLALARMIVSDQNGTIKAENRKNGGAKFTIRFYKGAV